MQLVFLLFALLAFISAVVADNCQPATFPNLADASTSGPFKVINLPCTPQANYKVILADRKGCPAAQHEGVNGLHVVDAFNAPMLVSLPAPAMDNSRSTTNTFQCNKGMIDIMVSLRTMNVASEYGVTLQQLS